jgi:hypothetical protein
VDDHLDPFAGIESDAEESTGIVEPSPGADAHELEDTFGEIATSPTPVEEYPVAPKIVRTGEIGVSNERVITPPSRVATIPSKVVATETESVVSQGQEMRSRHIEMDAELMTDQRDQIYWRNETPLVGFLVTYDHDPKGSYVELRQGRLIVSSQREESGSCLVVLGESVSPGGHVQVLDQLSESGTRVRHYGQAEEAFLSGEKSSLSHGDIVFFGDRKFHVLLVAGEGEGN